MWGCVSSAANQIGDEGAKGLAYALLTNSSLRALYLGGRGGEAGWYLFGLKVGIYLG